MKEEIIALRVDSVLKENFKKVCELEKTDMSDKIYQFINDEVKMKVPIDYEMHIETFLSMLGYSNIHILKTPTAGKGEDGKIYQECIGTLSLMKTGTMIFKDIIDFSDFLLKNKENEIYIYLIGSKLPNEIRCFVIER
jgi:antitoxin component of RelBE/YafQ-DinJ toxin-antitoxin module